MITAQLTAPLMFGEVLADVLLVCDECHASEKYENVLFYSDNPEHDMVDELKSGSYWEPWRALNDAVLCNECYNKRCLRRHPIDNHQCMLYAGHEGDHECCKKHMFY